MEKLDKQLLMAVGFLALFGLVMMSSVSIAESYRVTQGTKNDFYFWRHLIYLLLGTGGFFVGLKFPYDTLRKWSLFGYLVGISLLVVVLVVGDSYGTAAKSWIRIAGFSLQPVELMKLASIVFLSALWSNGKLKAGTLEGGFVPFLIVLGIPAVLIILQPDFGSLMVLLFACASIYFAAGANLKHIGIGGGMGVIGFAIAVATNPFIQRRINVFLDPSLDPLNTGFQVKQAQIAIGSGGLFGRGFQNSIQKFDYLPEVQSDTIFAAISEEMGFFFMVIILAIYVFIAFRGYHIAVAAPDLFTRLLAVGITTWIVGQAFINIAVNLALFPNTGITLPLLSYGGTSMITTLTSFGILLHISAHMMEGRKARYMRS